MQWVTKRGPWSFDNAMLAPEKVGVRENSAKVIPCFLNIWIQLYNFSMGYMLETVGKQMGNFFGEFLEYDAKNNTSIWRECMRVRFKIDVRKPLKRRKKITKKDGTEIMVECKYERSGEFCFQCGLVSHTYRFCRSSTGGDEEGLAKDWGSWLRAPPRKVVGQTQSKWLRNENDDTWEVRIGGENNKQSFSGGNNSNQDKGVKMASDYWGEIVTNSRNGKEIMLRVNEADFKGFKTTSNLVYESNKDDSEIIQLGERKRRRGVISGHASMDIDLGPKIGDNKTGRLQIGTGISSEDLSASSRNSTAELAMQASHHK